MWTPGLLGSAKGSDIGPGRLDLGPDCWIWAKIARVATIQALSDDGNRAWESRSGPKVQELPLSNVGSGAWEAGSGPKVQELALSDGGN